MSLELELLETLKKKNLSFAREIIKTSGKKRKGSSDTAYAFIITLLKILFPSISDDIIRESITDGSNDKQIDAIVVFRRGEAPVKIIWSSENSPSENRIRLFCESIEKYILGNEKLNKFENEFLYNQIEKAKKKIRKGKKLEIFVCWGGNQQIDEKVKHIAKELEKKYTSVSEIHFLSGPDLIRIRIKKTIEKINYEWKVSFVDDQPIFITIPNSGKEKSIAAIGRIKLIDIINLYKEFNEKGFNLFEKNVREFKRRKEISKGIKATLKDYPQLFYMFHNGITFVCKSIARQQRNLVIITNPQIINGCQTVNTLYNIYVDAKKSEDKKIISSLLTANVLCRIFVLDENLIEKVCQAANTQVKINPWDLRSNDIIQKIIQELFKEKQILINGQPIKYRRKIGARKNPNELTLSQLAQWIYATKFEKPAYAKSKKSSLFDVIKKENLYNKIFGTLKWKEIEDISTIGFFVINKIRKKKKIRKFEKYSDFHLMAGIYFLKRKGKLKDLSTKSLNRAYKVISKILSKVIRKMREKYGNDYLFIFTKTEETWKRMKELIEKEIELRQ